MEKISLREYQCNLSARLVNQDGGQPVSQLGVQAGASRWLVDLADAGEVIPVPPLSPVPFMQPWLAGLANVRGNLHAVIDFSVFLGGAPTTIGDRSRLLLIGEKYRVNCALLVDRVHGLYRKEQLTAASGTDPCAWSTGALNDALGNTWQQLDLGKLAANTEFLNVAA
jgi:twitching motility protein PilI